jgi:hypothetical protein
MMLGSISPTVSLKLPAGDSARLPIDVDQRKLPGMRPLELAHDFPPFRTRRSLLGGVLARVAVERRQMGFQQPVLRPAFKSAVAEEQRARETRGEDFQLAQASWRDLGGVVAQRPDATKEEKQCSSHIQSPRLEDFGCVAMSIPAVATTVVRVTPLRKQKRGTRKTAQTGFSRPRLNTGTG